MIINYISEYSIKMFQEEILKNEKYVLKGSFSKESINLSLSNIETQTQLQASLSSLRDAQMLSNYFDDLQGLFQYLKDYPKLISVNEQTKKLTIYSKIQTKKSNLIQIGNISFSQTFLFPKQPSLQAISHYFSSNQIFTNKQLASSISFIAQSLLRISQQKQARSSDQEVGIAQKIYQIEAISKQYIIEQSQRFYADLFQQIKQLKRQGQTGFSEIRLEIRSAMQNVQKLVEQKYLNIQEKTENETFLIKDHVQNLILDLSKQHNYQIWLKIKDYCSQQQSILKETLSQQSKKIQSFIKKQLSAFENLVQKTKQIKLVLNQDRFKNKSNMDQQEKNQLQEKQGKREQQQFLLKKNDLILKRSASQWIDQECYDFSRLTISQDIIKAKNGARVFGKSAKNKKFSFIVKVLNMHQLMKFGIIDGRYKKFNIFSNVESNRIVYWSDRSYFNGTQWKYNQGKGFKVSESVIVNVDLDLGIVQWRVGEEIRYEVQSEIIKKKDIGWVPYIFLWEKGDSVMVTYDY